MKKYFLLLLTISILIFSCKKSNKKVQKPKLVVGIVVDQMRYDYLTKYADRYGEDGFNRLLNDGYSLTNAHFSYMGTYTAVGHATAYTGTTPDQHGIIGNNWYDKYLKKSIYCVNDFNYTSVGTDGKAGQKSPNRMFTTTITDQLHFGQNMRGKTIGIAIKDRSSVLPAGHTANGAYWYHGQDENKWITSSYYMDELPQWVKDFNSNNKADSYISESWNTLYPIDTYKQSMADNNDFEGTFMGEATPTFPHDLPNLRKENGNFEIIKSTPFGNTLTLDFAKAAIKGENLGKDDDIDFLAISFSSTDYVGHKYGTDAIETEDTYLRFDKDLADLFQYLDTEVGQGNYTLFLTADHGAVQVPSYLQSVKVPAPYFKWKEFNNYIEEVTQSHFGSKGLIENFSNYQIFLNKETIKKLKLNEDEVADVIAKESLRFEGVYKTVTAKTLQNTNFTSGVLEKIQNSYNQKLSGDIILLPMPGTIGERSKGTTHGSPYSYDTHIPIIFYGAGIQKGMSHKRYGVRDIAPTLATLLKIEFPNGTTGQVIEEVLK
jgi:predicted AlkP superfamily pyrophosphatase or phosphodiesterase